MIPITIGSIIVLLINILKNSSVYHAIGTFMKYSNKLYSEKLIDTRQSICILAYNQSELINYVLNYETSLGSILIICYLKYRVSSL